MPSGVVSELRAADTGRRSEALFRDKLPALLTALAERARVASIEASSAIESVVVEDRVRADLITAGEVHGLRDRSEQDLAGYRAALDYLYQQDWRPMNIGLLLHLHRQLFRYTDVPGGQLKTTANLVVDRKPDGTHIRRFTPVFSSRSRTAGILLPTFEAAAAFRARSPDLFASPHGWPRRWSTAAGDSHLLLRIYEHKRDAISTALQFSPDSPDTVMRGKGQQSPGRSKRRQCIDVTCSSTLQD